jgi:geranylgeranyl diphosphate synthase type I
MPVESPPRVAVSSRIAVSPRIATPELAVGQIEQQLEAIEARWAVEQPDLVRLTSCLRTYIAAGGKRLRPEFCAWGAIGAGVEPDSPLLLDVCAALELLHAFALIHDDVMDGSATRRGQPAVHVAFDTEHRSENWYGEPRRVGEGLAVLVGDFAFVMADLLLGFAPLIVQALWHEMRLELVAGQWVDMMATARADRDPGRARWVARYKSGRYTVERPLHLGAAIAERPDLMHRYSRIGAPLGQAFQLRDDVLGVFGSVTVTGKPAGDDLREGKATTLLALTVERCASAADRQLLERAGHADLTGDEIDALRGLFVRTGALDEVEAEIERLAFESLDAIDALDLQGGADIGLRDIVQRCAWRDQ